MSTERYLRYIGGEAGHRNMFGGDYRTNVRMGLIGLFVIGGMIGVILFQWVGFLIALPGVIVTLILTANTHRGSRLDRMRARSRWNARKRLGTDQYEPYDVARWDQLQAAATNGTRAERAEAKRLMGRVRANPDGADGMGWLQYGSNQPGIAWHQPLGEESYLSVAFAVSGQLRGMESSTALRRSAEAFGAFMANRAGHSSLLRGVHPVTRVLPPDTARQQQWAVQSLARITDDTSDEERERIAEQRGSYDDVIRLASRDAMVQRHYVVCTWPISQDFRDKAEKYGEGRDGWRALMAAEIESVVRGLRDARMGVVTPMTARRTAAMILHQQNPHMPLDSVRYVDPLSFGLPSHDEFSAHVVEGYDPTSVDMSDPEAVPDQVTWWHRTFAIKSEHVAVDGRTPLWALDLLIGRELSFIRTVAFDINLVPAAEAKTASKKDLTRIQSDVIGDKRKGRSVNDNDSVALTGAQRRAKDLGSGSHHHGTEWVGYVTISARTRDRLAQASREIEEVCATGLGIEHLAWLDSYQAAASGMTWPIGRGIETTHTTAGTRLYGRLAGRAEKEALS